MADIFQGNATGLFLADHRQYAPGFRIPVDSFIIHMSHLQSISEYSEFREGKMENQKTQFCHNNCSQRTLHHTILKNLDKIVGGQNSLIPGLPNEISELCIARVARAAFTKLSCVCTEWRKLCESDEFLSLRVQLNCSESWIYVLAERPAAASFKAFDPKLDKWHDVPSVPKCEEGWYWQGFTCVAVGHRLLVMGGMYSRIDAQAQMHSPGMVSGDVEIYDASTMRWSKGQSMNTPRSWFAAAVVGDLVYVAGGQGRDRFLKSVEVYDPKKDQWAYLSDMTHVRSSCYGVALQGKFWVVGGEYERSYKRRGSAEIYDPATGDWSLIREMLIDSEKVPGPSTVYNGKLHLAHESKLMRYEEDANAWAHVGELSDGACGRSSQSARFAFALESINEEVYVIGGRRAGKDFMQFSNTTEVCNLAWQGSPKATRWRNAAGMVDREGIILASAVLTL